MLHVFRDRLFVFTLVIASLVPAGRSSEAQSATQVWTRWETALHSSKSYDNPCRDAVVRVTYTGPQEQTIRGYGFWDGDNTFRLRCALPAPGTWQWQTECSDASNAGLHGKSGTVEVAQYNGKNRLYQHGFVRVSDNKRFLCYADGTPLLWIGDTAWAAAMKSSATDWETYLADRAKKRFTVIQIGPASHWTRMTFAEGKGPFLGKGITKPNPTFWRSYEDRVQRANESGFYVMMVGLMEPSYRYPESAEACIFAREMIARLFGNFVAFSPSFDSVYMPLADEVGGVARDATNVHLITQHPGTPSGKPTQIFSERYFDRPYMDFCGVQTGHNGGRRELCAGQAIQWNLHLYRREPHMPVVNLEAYYNGGDNKGGTAADARSLGWLSLLSGAAGYTYGSGVYKWITDPESDIYWRKCMTLESSDQMTMMHDFFTRLEWWRLAPAHGLIRNQPKQATKQSVLAATDKRDLAVAYLPNNAPIEVDLKSFPAKLRGRWFNPVTAGYTDVQGAVSTSRVQRFTPPGPGDWVLLLTAEAAKGRALKKEDGR